MRRLVLLLVALALAPAAHAAPAPKKSWADAQIQLVTTKGLMGADARAFRPDDPLTQGDLADLLTGITGKPQPAPADLSAGVTIAQLDFQLVRALNLRDVARQFASALRAAGLTPPSRFGTEVVARLLGLRTDHAEDTIEPVPDAAATRAEAAYSAARILSFSGWEVDQVRGEAATFAPPAVDGVQRQLLQVAISLIGYPYVWGGTSEQPQQLFGRQVNGGFDCSGFVWRVVKLQDYGLPGLADTLKGRTTYAMSGEVQKAQRISLANLQPADLVFFGDGGPKAKAADINHMGISLGGGWFIHSSGEGVVIAPIAGWYEKRFAWGRRPLAELQPSV